jgi:hypothetical protein
MCGRFTLSKWDNVAWFQQEWVWELGGWLLGLAFSAALLWFIDGYNRYGYWKDEEDLNEQEDKKE